VHVFASPDGWVVQREGTQRAASVFATQKEAILKARTIARTRSVSGQMVVHGRNGLIKRYAAYGLPKVQDPPGKRDKRIERAVSKFVLERLNPSPQPVRD
jgi:hypothetical protein